MKNTAANCPVSGVKVNESVVRAVALLVVLLALTAIYLGSYTICFVLSIDFALRAFTTGEHSLLRIAGVSLSKLAGLKNKPTDAAPKKFAACVGFIFSLGAGTFLLFDYILLANSLLFILIFCAFLESFFSVCLGCIVYGWLQKINFRRTA